MQDACARLVSRLQEQGQEIRRLVSGLDEEVLATPIVPGKWSLKELVCHLWRVQEVFEARIEAMLTQNSPIISRYEPNGDPEFEQRLRATAAELVEGLLTEREQLVTLLDSLSSGDWRRSGSHPDFRHFDVQFQVEYMVWHEAHHIYQMMQRRAALGRLPH
jgi:hypothetical protein